MQEMNMSTQPLQIAEHRRQERTDKHVEQRSIQALELIADTLEAIRLDLAKAISMLESGNRMPH
jgi:hypothetical protein